MKMESLGGGDGRVRLMVSPDYKERDSVSVTLPNGHIIAFTCDEVIIYDPFIQDIPEAFTAIWGKAHE